MDIQATDSLSERQKEQIAGLVVSCKEQEELRLSFPYDGAKLYLTAYGEDGQLLAAAAFTLISDALYECSAFTRPSYRNRGYFSALLSYALDALPEETEFIFAVDECSFGTKKTLKALQAEYIYGEFMMELPAAALPTLSAPSLCCRSSFSEGNETLAFSDDFGSLFILCYPKFYYLYGFEIIEQARGAGHGSALLLSALSALSKRKVMPVRLQVTSKNSPAVSLYKKTGFQIIETLSYYLY